MISRGHREGIEPYSRYSHNGNGKIKKKQIFKQTAQTIQLVCQISALNGVCKNFYPWGGMGSLVRQKCRWNIFINIGNLFPNSIKFKLFCFCCCRYAVHGSSSGTQRRLPSYNVIHSLK